MNVPTIYWKKMKYIIKFLFCASILLSSVSFLLSILLILVVSVGVYTLPTIDIVYSFIYFILFFILGIDISNKTMDKK